MGRFALLCLTAFLLILGPLPGQSAVHASDHLPATTCVDCCNDQSGDCETSLAACERICSVAVISVPPAIASQLGGELRGHQLPRFLAHFSGRPVPPPPREHAHRPQS
jgi:hypothetical protein